MLTRVEVYTLQGAQLGLELRYPTDGIALAEIEGLDPVKAILVSSSFAQMDGQQYHTSRRDFRNIKLKIVLDPDYIHDSVRDVRTRLYDYFMPKQSVLLRFFMSDGLTVDINGRVETFETLIFSKEPEVYVSIVCFDPDFFIPTPIVLDGSTVHTTNEMSITYSGTVETGFVFELYIDRTVHELSLYLRSPDGLVNSMDISGDKGGNHGFLAGDTLTISTVVGAKSITLLRSNATSSFLYGLSAQSAWLELVPGTNYFRAYISGASIPYAITYTTKYGGL
jgi:hypothetical protein